MAGLLSLVVVRKLHKAGVSLLEHCDTQRLLRGRFAMRRFQIHTPRAVPVDADRKPLMELCARACVERMLAV